MKNMKTPAYIISNESVTIIGADGKPYTVTSSNANFNLIKQRLSEGSFDRIEELFDQGKAIENYTNGDIIVKNNEIIYNGRVIHNSVCDKILGFVRENFPAESLISFLSKLMENPSQRSVEQLYSYIERYKLPIADDGDFIAWKAIRADYTDKYTGKIDNHVGKIVEMPRNECVDDHNIACASSLHCGNWDYVKEYGNKNDDRFIVVKVNPRDVVSCPIESEWQKLRVCRYEVIGEVTKDNVKEFTSEYAPIAQPEIFGESEITPSDVDDEEWQNEKDDSDYDEGFIAGSEDFSQNFRADVTHDTKAVHEGYVDGWNEAQDEYDQLAIHKPKIKPETRKKLSKHAKAQKRNKFGRFI